MIKRNPISAIFFLTLLIACTPGESTSDQMEETTSDNITYSTIPAYSASGKVNVVVEIPAGTNHKKEYNYDNNSFPVDKKDGKERVIDFLPYPGNYGFIPSTMMDKERGGDGDALDVIVIGEHRATGTVVEVEPIGILRLLDRGEIDDKIIAVPADESKRIIDDVDSFKSLEEESPESAAILKAWFLNYKGVGVMEFKGWGTKEAAFAEIEKWMIKQ